MAQYKSSAANFFRSDVVKSEMQCFHHVQWWSRVLGGSMSRALKDSEVGGDFHTV